MIPSTLQEAVAAVEGLMGDEERAYLKELDEELNRDPQRVATHLHHSLGRFLRNEWELWAGGPLAIHLREEHGVLHPDDMSHFIIEGYLRSRYPSCWKHLLKSQE